MSPSDIDVLFLTGGGTVVGDGTMDILDDNGQRKKADNADDYLKSPPKNIIPLPQKEAEKALEQIAANFSGLHFIFAHYPAKDSKDITDQDIAAWAQHIADKKRYQYVIVTVGTDAMVDIALLLEKALQELHYQGKVLFTGAMVPLILKGSDGRKNITYAIDAIYKTATHAIDETSPDWVPDGVNIAMLKKGDPKIRVHYPPDIRKDIEGNAIVDARPPSTDEILRETIKETRFVPDIPDGSISRL